MKTQDELKRAAAQAAFEHVRERLDERTVIGVGTGSTAAPELPGQSVTTWAERTELFMEYPPLIGGREARFAAHVTEMPTFRAVTSGRARRKIPPPPIPTPLAIAAPTDPCCPPPFLQS